MTQCCANISGEETTGAVIWGQNRLPSHLWKKTVQVEPREEVLQDPAARLSDLCGISPSRRLFWRSVHLFSGVVAVGINVGTWADVAVEPTPLAVIHRNRAMSSVRRSKVAAEAHCSRLTPTHTWLTFSRLYCVSARFVEHSELCFKV
jgi:hypothetical protein